MWRGLLRLDAPRGHLGAGLGLCERSASAFLPVQLGVRACGVGVMAVPGVVIVVVTVVSVPEESGVLPHEKLLKVAVQIGNLGHLKLQKTSHKRPVEGALCSVLGFQLFSLSLQPFLTMLYLFYNTFIADEGTSEQVRGRGREGATIHFVPVSLKF